MVKFHACSGEQSLNAARSALSPDAGRPHEAQMERAPSHGPSVRGMFSDLKRTMERVGELSVHTILHNCCLAATHANRHNFQVICIIVLDMSEAT